MFHSSRSRIAVATSLALIFVLAIAGCSSSSSDESETPTTIPATTASPNANQLTATADNVTAPGPASGPSGEIKVALGLIQSIDAIVFDGSLGAAHRQFGGVTENLFWAEGGDPMTPLLAETWSVNDEGTLVTIQMREGVRWNPPLDQQQLDLGFVTAGDIALWLNLSNLATNSGSLHHNGGDYATVYREARAPDDRTLEINLATPIFFGLPGLSEFSIFGAGVGPDFVRGIEQFSAEWANNNAVGTGPYVVGECIAGERCELHALPEHWRKTGSISQITMLQVDRSGVLPLIENGLIDISLVAQYGQLQEIIDSGLKFVETQENGFVGQSVMWSGNLWEETHAISGGPLNPWSSAAYERDLPWIGDPWQESHPEKVRYVDSDNPAGMTDMEQARLVRLALSIAIDRKAIVEEAQGFGLPLYSEYMGPEYEGWDPERVTAVWTHNGTKLEPSGSANGVPWQLVDGNLVEADRLLTLAGYPLVDGVRTGFKSGFRLQEGGIGEVGGANIFLTDLINALWAELGIPIVDGPEEPLDAIAEYSAVIQPRLRTRDQFFPLLKNGDIVGNRYPIDYPYASFDTSLSRGGTSSGFESPYLSRQLISMVGERDKEMRTQQHLDVADYMLYWQLYSGVIQFPRGLVTSPRIESIGGPIAYISKWSNHPEFIVLSDSN